MRIGKLGCWLTWGLARLGVCKEIEAFAPPQQQDVGKKALGLDETCGG